MWRPRRVPGDTAALVGRRAHEIELLAARGRDTSDRSHSHAARQTAELRASLRALSPGATLARGYAIAHVAGGVIVRDAAQAPEGTELTVTVARGSFAATSGGEVPETSGTAADA